MEALRVEVEKKIKDSRRQDLKMVVAMALKLTEEFWSSILSLFYTRNLELKNKDQVNFLEPKKIE